MQVEVFTAQHQDTPDAIFPNNWVSTHKNSDIPEGLLVVYPMLAPSRQKEENEEILARLKPDYQHYLHLPSFYKKTIFPGEYEGRALEGTGSLIFDTVNKKIYCAISERADEQLIDDFLLRFNTISNS